MSGLDRVLGVQVLVLAKAPVPGRVKTRLAPPYSLEEAAGLAAAALLDTLHCLAVTPVRRRVLVLDGPADLWRPPGVDLHRQRGSGLDERLEYAVLDAWADTPLPVLLVGMDTPQLTADLLAGAARRLLAPGVDAVLGPATDGGFWAIGMRRPRPGLVRGVPMSRADTAAHQHARLAGAGLRVAALPVLTDVDDAATADEAASAAPGSRFAAALRACREGAA